MRRLYGKGFHLVQFYVLFILFSPNDSRGLFKNFGFPLTPGFPGQVGDGPTLNSNFNFF